MSDENLQGRLGTPEQIAEALRVRDEAVANGLSTNTTEYRRLNMLYLRLKRTRQVVSLTDRRRKVERMEQRAARVQRVTESAFQRASPQEIETVRLLVMSGSETYVRSLLADMEAKPGAQVTAERAHEIRKDARAKYHDLLKLLFGKALDKEPMQKRTPRKVTMAEFPAEGAKS